MGRELLTVGLMARLSGLTVKALRHYDRTGLLRPAAVDGATGYRLYRGDQVAEARLVRLLRSLDLPLDRTRDRPGRPGNHPRPAPLLVTGSPASLQKRDRGSRARYR
jgi:DNA-binding transcriptional MerR regulator